MTQDEQRRDKAKQSAHAEQIKFERAVMDTWGVTRSQARGALREFAQQVSGRGQSFRQPAAAPPFVPVRESATIQPPIRSTTTSGTASQGPQRRSANEGTLMWLTALVEPENESSPVTLKRVLVRVVEEDTSDDYETRAVTYCRDGVNVTRTFIMSKA